MSYTAGTTAHTGLATPLDRVRSFSQQARRTLMLRGFLGLVLGGFILVRPLESVAAFALVVALWALADGSVMIVAAVEARPIAPHWWIFLVGGVLGVLFGVSALYFFPGLSLSFAVLWVALWLTTIGVAASYLALKERKLGFQWRWTMAFGCLALVAGILAVLYPEVTLGALMNLIATFGIVAGVSLIVGANKVRTLQRRVETFVRGTVAREHRHTGRDPKAQARHNAEA